VLRVRFAITAVKSNESTMFTYTECVYFAHYNTRLPALSKGI
jgi:hypothetical protein